MRHLSVMTMTLAIALVAALAVGHTDTLPRNDDFRFGGPAMLGGTVDPTCTADTNDDNVVNVEDLVNVVLLWGTDGQAPGVDADVTGNGNVDVEDLVEVILQWGPCP